MRSPAVRGLHYNLARTPTFRSWLSKRPCSTTAALVRLSALKNTLGCSLI